MLNSKNQKGSLVIEASFTLVIFICVLASIISLANVYILHNKVQYAITQSANSIAYYGYIYSASGLKAVDKQHSEDVAEDTKDLETTAKNILNLADSVDTLKGDASNAGSSLGSLDISSTMSNLEKSFNDLQTVSTQTTTVMSNLKTLVSDPKGLFVAVVQFGLSELKSEVKSIVAKACASSLTEKFLTTSSQSADTYLKNQGVVDGVEGLDFDGSTMFNDSDMKIVDIVVQYDVNIQFAFITKKIHMVQRSVAISWTDGDGKSYKST